MKRIEERKTDLIHATNRLKEALEKEADDITIDGVIHRYEFTFELAWKTLKDYLEYLGISSNTGSPREVLKESYVHNLIENGEVWIYMMRKNLERFMKILQINIFLKLKNWLSLLSINKTQSICLYVNALGFILY